MIARLEQELDNKKNELTQAVAKLTTAADSARDDAQAAANEKKNELKD